MRDSIPSARAPAPPNESSDAKGRGPRRKPAKPRKPYPPPDALVAILKTTRDLARVRDEGWYRIPANKAPAALAEGTIRTLAFYLPRGHGADAFHVAYSAPVRELRTQPRRELLPEEADHPRAGQHYLRVALGPLRRLPHPIPSQRLRRLVFIPTTLAKLRHAQEINDLFHDSPLEDTLWEAFQAAGIGAERQYFVPGDDQGLYALDFAIFGQRRNLNVECDGDRYHANPIRGRADNRRNNYLTTRGWSVLRFSTGEIEDDLPHVMGAVHAALVDCGGAVSPTPTESPAPPELLWQPALWDAELAFGHTVDPHVPARRQRRVPKRRS